MTGVPRGSTIGDAVLMKAAMKAFEVTDWALGRRMTVELRLSTGAVRVTPPRKIKRGWSC